MSWVIIVPGPSSPLSILILLPGHYITLGVSSVPVPSFNHSVVDPLLGYLYSVTRDTRPGSVSMVY